jgi:hypothetical protein
VAKTYDYQGIQKDSSHTLWMTQTGQAQRFPCLSCRLNPPQKKKKKKKEVLLRGAETSH